MIFSGSALVGWKNSSGFGKDGKPPMVAIHTGCRVDSDGIKFECIAYSNDKGRTWTKYAAIRSLASTRRNFAIQRCSGMSRPKAGS